MDDDTDIDTDDEDDEGHGQRGIGNIGGGLNADLNADDNAGMSRGTPNYKRALESAEENDWGLLLSALNKTVFTAAELMCAQFILRTTLEGQKNVAIIKILRRGLTTVFENYVPDVNVFLELQHKYGKELEIACAGYKKGKRVLVAQKKCCQTYFLMDPKYNKNIQDCLCNRIWKTKFSCNWGEVIGLYYGLGGQLGITYIVKCDDCHEDVSGSRETFGQWTKCPSQDAKFRCKQYAISNRLEIIRCVLRRNWRKNQRHVNAIYLWYYCSAGHCEKPILKSAFAKKVSTSCGKCLAEMQAQLKTILVRRGEGGDFKRFERDDDENKVEKLTFHHGPRSFQVDSLLEIDIFYHLFTTNTMINVSNFHLGFEVQKTFAIVNGSKRYKPDGFSESDRMVLEIRSSYTNNCKLVLTESCIIKCTASGPDGGYKYLLLYGSRFSNTFLFVDAKKMKINDFKVWDLASIKRNDIIQKIQDKIGYFVELYAMFWEPRVIYCTKTWWHTYNCGDINLLVLSKDH